RCSTCPPPRPATCRPTGICSPCGPRWRGSRQRTGSTLRALSRRAARRWRGVIGRCGGGPLRALAGGGRLRGARMHWAAGAGVEWAGTVLAVLPGLADLSKAAGDPEEALRCLRTVLTVDPCHEDAARAMMTLLAHEGRRGEALEVYRALAAALEAELGAAPA